ncbi:kinase-like domain, phloem protein 2-like protein [Tanacetum coccineum]
MRLHTLVGDSCADCLKPVSRVAVSPPGEVSGVRAALVVKHLYDGCHWNALGGSTCMDVMAGSMFRNLSVWAMVDLLLGHLVWDILDLVFNFLAWNMAGMIDNFSMVSSEEDYCDSYPNILYVLYEAISLCFFAFVFKSVPTFKNFDDVKLTEITVRQDGHNRLSAVSTSDFGNAYTGQLLWSGELIKIDARRFNKDEWDDEKEQQFWMEISLLSTLKHKNVVSLVGFCDENDENIIVTKFETWLSLDNYLSDAMMLTWVRRLEICVGLANALSYIHYDEAREFSVIHRNIDSLNVLLNDNWEPKLSEFRLSMKIEASQRHHSFRVDKVRDIEGYTDPTYIETKMANHKSDIYSFGIVMFELVCGRKAVINDDQDNKYLAPMAILHYREDKLEDIVEWNLWKQIDPQSFEVFTEIAYACLNEEPSQRPDINEIITKLEKALELARVNQPPLLLLPTFLLMPIHLEVVDVALFQ